MILRNFHKFLLTVILASGLGNAFATIHSSVQNNSFQIQLQNQSNRTWLINKAMASNVQFMSSFTDIGPKGSPQDATVTITDLTPGQLTKGGLVLISYISQDNTSQCVFATEISPNGPGHAISNVEVEGDPGTCKFTQTGDGATGQFNLILAK